MTNKRPRREVEEMDEMERVLFVGSTLESQHTSDLAAHLTAALFGSIDDTTDAEVDEPND